MSHQWVPVSKISGVSADFKFLSEMGMTKDLKLDGVDNAGVV